MPHKKIAAFIARANAWGRFSTKGIRRTAAIGFSALSAIGMFATPLHAQDFIIGQTADHSAVQSASVKEMTDAAKAYFDKINNAGGIDGREIKLISLDDKFDPKLSVSNAKKLIEENDVMLMALGRGTSNAEALLPVLNEYRVPLVGHVGGSLAMHEPPTRYFFNLRPPYRVEVERAIGQLVAQGASKIGVVYTDDAFGKDAFEGFKTGMQATKLTPAVVTSIERGDAKVAEAVKQIVSSKADSVIGLCVPKPCATLVRALRVAGYTGRFLSLSNTSSSAYLKELGDHARGVIVTQVFPAPDSAAVAVANDFQKLAAEYKLPLSYTAMEGYINARVVVEALRRAGAKPTREKVTAALESMRKLDFGGYVLSFGPTDRTGSDVVNLTIIGKDGRFLR
jgi:branched-chain amino acid transport system substrate-binding protein